MRIDAPRSTGSNMEGYFKGTFEGTVIGLDDKLQSLDQKIETEKSTREEKDTVLQQNIDTEVQDRKNADEALQQTLNKKQDTLIPGKNITIVDNVISATGGGDVTKEYVDSAISTEQQRAEEVEASKQDKSNMEQSITPSETNYPSSKAVVNYVNDRHVVITPIMGEDDVIVNAEEIYNQLINSPADSSIYVRILEEDGNYAILPATMKEMRNVEGEHCININVNTASTYFYFDVTFKDGVYEGVAGYDILVTTTEFGYGLDLKQDKNEMQSVITESTTNYPSSKAVVDYAAKKSDLTTLSETLQAETQTRAQADSDLHSQIDDNAGAISDIEDKIPEEASSTNKLADKAFVNSSIASNTANFIGTFETLEELKAYSGTVTNNDYAFIRARDGQGNIVFKRYKYTLAQNDWVFEYDLNNSSFTAAQWETINSGLTGNDVTDLRDALELLELIVPETASGDNKLVTTDYVESRHVTLPLLTVESSTQEEVKEVYDKIMNAPLDAAFYLILSGGEGHMPLAVAKRVNEVYAQYSDSKYGYKLKITKVGDQYELSITRSEFATKVDLEEKVDFEPVPEEEIQVVGLPYVEYVEQNLTEEQKQRVRQNIGAQETLPLERGEGENSVVQSGGVNIATGQNSSAFGYGNSVTGTYAHAEGQATDAKGNSSHTEGLGTKTISGSTDISEWRQGTAAHAEGMGTKAAGNASHAEGSDTITNNPAEHAEGRFNRSHTTSEAGTWGNARNTLHSVGIGTNEFDRKNAFEIMQNGDAYLTGIGGYDGQNVEEANTVQEEFATMATEIDNKTEKVRIDIVANGSTYQFKKGDEVLNFQQLNDMLQNTPDFLIFVHGNREHRCVFIDTTSSQKVMRFVAPIISDGVLKTQAFTIISNDGIAITAVTKTDINSENQSNKKTSITGTGNNSDYPTTKAVVDYAAPASELTELSIKIDEFKVKDASVSGNTLNITKEDGTILPFTPQGGTPSGDPMHYAYVQRGAEYNDTASVIIKTDEFGEHPHLPRHWYLNGLGDITTEQIRDIFTYTANIWLPDSCDLSYCTPWKVSLRTNFNIVMNSEHWVGANRISGTGPFFINMAESIALTPNSELRFNGDAIFFDCTNLVSIYGIVVYQSQGSAYSFKRCHKLTNVMVKTMYDITFSDSPLLSPTSIHYMITNAINTSPITITLHADAKARWEASEYFAEDSQTCVTKQIQIA